VKKVEDNVDAIHERAGQTDTIRRSVFESL